MLQQLPRIIAFTGPKGSGKDTAASALLSRNSLSNKDMFQKMAFADTVKAITMMAFDLTLDQVESAEQKETPLQQYPQGQTPRAILQDTANWYRERFGQDVWVEAWKRNYYHSTTGCVIVTDLRFPNEAKLLLDLGAQIIYVGNKKAEDSLDAAKAEGDSLANNVSESHYTYLFRIATDILHNNGSLEELFKNTHDVVVQRWGHWDAWDCEDLLVHRIRKGEF